MTYKLDLFLSEQTRTIRDPISRPQNQKENKYVHKLTKRFTKDMQGKTDERLFLKETVIKKSQL